MTSIDSRSDNVPEPGIAQDVRVIFFISLGHAVAHFFNLLLPPLFPWLKTAFALSWGQLGWLLTVYFAVSGLAQAFAGGMVDKWGARRVLYVGLLCMAFAACLMALAQSYTMLLLAAIVAGLGNSVFHPADFTLLNKCVGKQRLAHGFSMHGVAGQLGWAAAPFFMFGIASLAGWRAALLSAALLPLLALLGLMSIKPCLGRAAPLALRSIAGTAPNLPYFLRQPVLWACFAFFFVTALALGGVQSFAPVGVQQLYGTGATFATTCLTLYMLGSAGGMLMGGFLAARSQSHEKIVLCGFGVAGLAAGLIASRDVTPILVLALMALMGAGAGLAGPARDFLIRAAAPAQAMGLVYGLVYGGLELGFALAPLFFSRLIEIQRPDLVLLCIGLCQWLAILTALGVKKRCKGGVLC